MTRGRAEARARVPEGHDGVTTASEGDEPNRYVVVELLDALAAGAVVATPGLTALDLDGARRVLLEDSLRAADLVAAHAGRSSTSARAAARPASRSRTRCPTRVRAARGRAAQVRASSSGGRRRTRASSGGAPRSRGPTGPASRWRRRSRRRPSRPSGACRSCGRAGSRCSGSARRPSRRAWRAVAGAACGRAGRRSPPGCSSLRKLGPDARRASRAEPAWRGSGRSPEAVGDGSGVRAATTLRRVPAGSTPSRTRRAASARRRPPSISRPAWPRRASGRSSSTSTRRRTRPPGSGCARTAPRATTCSTARRSSELAKPTAFPNLFLIPSKPELAGAAVELSRRDDGERFLADVAGRTPRASTSSCSTARPRSAR